MLTACETHRPAPLPAAEWHTVEDARQILIDRQNAIESVQTQLKFRIQTPPPPPEKGSTKSGGKTHTLDAALVIRGDDHLRLRAWKLGQTVFDLTVNPEGTFVVAADEMTDRAPDAERDLARLADQLGAMLRGPDWTSAHLRIEHPAHHHRRQLRADWDHAHALIPTRELVPEVLVFLDGEQRVELWPRYTSYDGLIWYHRVAAEGPFGVIELNFYDVQLNTELNPRAFKPPQRAKKIETEKTGSDSDTGANKQTVSDTVSEGGPADP